MKATKLRFGRRSADGRYPVFYGPATVIGFAEAYSGHWQATIAPDNQHECATRGDAGDWLLKQHLASQRESQP